MNKKYIVGGFIFWAGLSGYMGLRILESYTEDAVFAALSAVPAQAQEIRYSFLRNTLSLKGVEYELPDKSVMHKGSIEKVEVKGFNRKCMFVKPDMPAYDADALPVVAESISLEGIVDNIHVGQTRIEQKIADVQVRGWYQRLGMLLDQRSQHGGEASYYEELYRCRLDGLDINNVYAVVSDPALPVAMTVNVEKLALADGVRAPRGKEKVPPVSLYVSGIRFSNRTYSGALQRMDIRNLLLPDPENMAKIVRLFRDSGVGSDKADGQNDVVSMSPEERIGAVQAALRETYDKRLPYSLIGCQGASITVKGPQSSVVLSLNGITGRLSMESGEKVRSSAELSKLHIALPREGDKIYAVIARYAPNGPTLSVKVESLMDDREYVATSRYVVEGLGELESEIVLVGDMASFSGTSVFAPDDAYLDLMRNLRLKKLVVDYKDSGLLPMALELVAWREVQNPEDLQAQLIAAGDELSQLPDKLFQDLGSILKEQVTTPGDIRMTFTSEKEEPVMDLVNTLFMEPGSVPLRFSSTPGAKTLTDYLQMGKE
ncbi:hypothetical protein [Mailhella sp.]|uniref:hypothetical protein n=1 Tax=Mailhella sp. TaxID=1981029 RepID=UPI003AB17B49